MTSQSSVRLAVEPAPAALHAVAVPLELQPTPPRSGLRREFVRYLFVGGAAFVADFSTLALLKELGVLGVLPAAAVAFLVGTLVNYAISTRWVFTQRNVRNRGLEFALFAVIGLCGLGLNHLLIWWLTASLHAHYLAAKLVSTGTVLGWNFFARKLTLFRG